MYLTAYHFEGDPAALAAAHDELTSRYFPQDSLDVHLCVTTGTGIVVYDACPSREVAEAFHQGEAFQQAISAAGLPVPRIESIGDVVWSTAGVK